MRTPFLALLILLPLVAAPAHASNGVHERNVAFLWSLVGEIYPSTDATMPDGRVIPLADAIADAAARAGSVDLAALASGAAPAGLPVFAGDVWVIELGTGECSVASTGLPFPSAMLMPQLGWYGGEASMMATAHGYTTEIIGWSMKESYLGVNTAGFTALGNTDAYCFTFGGMHLAFPFVDGIVTMN